MGRTGVSGLRAGLRRARGAALLLCALGAVQGTRTALSPDVAALAWGDTAFSAQMPVVEDNGAGAWVSVTAAALAEIWAYPGQ